MRNPILFSKSDENKTNPQGKINLTKSFILRG